MQHKATYTQGSCSHITTLSTTWAIGLFAILIVDLVDVFFIAFADTYFTIVGASLPLLGIAMAGTAILRSAGDAKLAMWSTIAGGVVNAILDPILIFDVGMGLSGAAIASVISRLVVVAVAVFGLIRKHDLLGRIDTPQIWSDFRLLNKIAVPSVITILSGPIGASYATMQMAKFGTDPDGASPSGPWNNQQFCP